MHMLKSAVVATLGYAGATYAQVSGASSPCPAGFESRDGICVAVPQATASPNIAPLSLLISRSDCIGRIATGGLVNIRNGELGWHPDGCNKCRCTNRRLTCTRKKCSGPIDDAQLNVIEPPRTDYADKYLYVWYGDDDQKDPDFLATLDFDRKSPNYGKVISTSPLAGWYARKNEPHHVGISADKKTIIAGGLLGWVNKQPDLFFFDLSRDPKRPRFNRAMDAPLSSTTDDFVSLPNGNTLISMMGGPDGGYKGRILELDTNNRLVGEWPRDPPQDFTPHGIAIRPEVNLMITSDFVVPNSTIGAGPREYRQTVRVWDLEKREITKTIKIEKAASIMDLALIPNDPQQRVYAPAQSGNLFLVNTLEGTWEEILTFSEHARPATPGTTTPPGTKPHILRFRKDGKRAWMTAYEAGKVIMFDTTDVRKPRILRVIDLGHNSGPHYLGLTSDEGRLVVTDYFLDNSYFGGNVKSDGDRRTHVFLLGQDDFQLDPLWFHDGDLAFNVTGPARPHGVVMV